MISPSVREQACEPELQRRKRVVIALDGSPAAAAALPVARVAAAQLGADLAGLHVVSQPTTEATVRDQLQSDPALACDVEVGDPAAQILATAADPKVALVVLTTHGAGSQELEGRRDMANYLGPVAETVAAHTVRPVLLVRPDPDTKPQVAVSEFRRLLLPLDGSPRTLQALGPAVDIACRLGAAIDILYVTGPGHRPLAERGGISPPRYVDQPQHEWPQWAREVVAQLSGCIGRRMTDLPLRVFHTHGDIVDEIANFASEHRADAVILVRRSHLEPGRARVLRSVLLRTPCPALLVGMPASTKAASTPP